MVRSSTAQATRGLRAMLECAAIVSWLLGASPAPRRRAEIDAKGLVVAPGFIDLHTHSDQSLLTDGNAESKVRQGVTVDVIGESTSVAPRDGLAEAKDTWTDFSGYWRALGQKGISMNVISEVSFQQLRLVAVGYNPGPATIAQLERMKTLAARSMEEGAWGLVARFESGGPEQPEEVLEVAKVVAKYDGIYVTHIGSEGAEQDRELDFAIRVAQEAKLPVHIFHLKIRGEETGAPSGNISPKSKRRALAASTSRPTSIRTRRCNTGGARFSRCGRESTGRRSSPPC